MKRLIKSSVGDKSYTSYVDMIIPSAVDDILQKDVSDVDVPTLRAAVDAFLDDYGKIPSGMDGLDIIYDEDKGRIYRKYRPFADKCKDLLEYYQKKKSNSALTIKERRLCNMVLHHFPYGWKQHGR